MQNVLADLALESEAAMALTLRVARAVDAAPREPSEAAFARIVTAIGKYWICKRAPALVNEAQECLGGAGYVEESILPRLYRQAPLNSIWEGSGNIQCLDVLRALAKEPETREALFGELLAAQGRAPRPRPRTRLADESLRRRNHAGNPLALCGRAHRAGAAGGDPAACRQSRSGGYLLRLAPGRPARTRVRHLACRSADEPVD